MCVVVITASYTVAMTNTWLVFVAKTICHRIIKSLIPSSVVPETAVLKLVSAVCADVPSTVTQVNTVSVGGLCRRC